MKARKIIWPILFLVTGLICWLSIPPVPQARIRANLPLNVAWGKRYFNGPDVAGRIKVENDSSAVSVSGVSPHASDSSYDPYFIHVNDFRQILIPASKSKMEKREIVLPP